MVCSIGSQKVAAKGPGREGLDLEDVHTALGCTLEEPSTGLQQEGKGCGPVNKTKASRYCAQSDISCAWMEMPAILSMTLNIKAVVPSIGLRHGHFIVNASRRCGMQAACPPLLCTVSNAGQVATLTSNMSLQASHVALAPQCMASALHCALK